MENSQSEDPVVQLKPHLIYDSVVNCIMCGDQMPLSQLVAHQNQCLSRPKWKTGFNVREHKRCIFCDNHPWVLRNLMDRHLQRKHPKEFRAMKLQQQPTITSTAETEKCTALNSKDNTTSQNVSVAAPIPQPKTVAAEKTPALDSDSRQQVSCARSRFGSINGYPILSVEQDTDGYAELVLTIN